MVKPSVIANWLSAPLAFHVREANSGVEPMIFTIDNFSPQA
jgi:hypothetical protein